MEIVIVLILVALYIWLIYLFFRYVFLWLAIPGGIVASGWAICNFVLALRECFRGNLPATANNGPTGPEPAFRQYFFRKAYLDFRDVVFDNISRNRKAIELLLERENRLLYGREANEEGSGLWVFTWPLAVAVGAIGVVGIAVAIAINVVFALVFAILVGLCVLANATATAAILGAEKAILVSRRFVIHCPKCYQRFSLPIYECPSCHGRHKRLIPGTYGILRRRCQCGELLPTSYLTERHRLESFCPHCDNRLEGEDPTLRPVLMPVIAGRSAGKTAFQVALLMRLLERQNQKECRLSIISPNDQSEFEAAIAMLNRGLVLPQTLDRVPKALQLNFFDEKGAFTNGQKNSSRLRLHLYDAAGEAFEDEITFAQLTFLKHCSGIVMLIDPFSIEKVRARYQRQISELPSDVGASDADPDDVYSRLLEFLEQHRVRVGTKRVKIPLAVVVTKSDAFGLDSEVGQSAFNHWQQIEVGRANSQNRAPRPIDTSAVVRRWLLAQDLARLIEKLEAQFALYRYFSCSALGRPPSHRPGEPFRPVGLESPFAWILRVMDVQLAV